MLSFKTPIVLKPNYTMSLENFNNMLWFHTDVYRWSKQVKQEFIKDLNTVQELITIPLAALVEDNNQKLMKFATVIGFTPAHSVAGDDGKTYNILSRSL